MAWRGLHISRASRLSLADRQCVIAQEAGETRLALEDIAWIVLDTPQASLTTNLLTACMEAGIAIIVTDERHHPSGICLPFHRHHRQAEIASMQLAASHESRRRLWQGIVQAKIRNQACCLDLCGKTGTTLRAMSKHITPGDPENVEARAARFYWSRLFANFTRENPADLRNSMLNYGYAVMRGAVARGLVAAGLLPAIGVHHAGSLNPFNLADDMIEPFRPVVDLVVWRHTERGSHDDGDLTVARRQALAGVLLKPVRMGIETVSALVASEMAAASLARSLDSAAREDLALPELCDWSE